MSVSQPGKEDMSRRSVTGETIKAELPADCHLNSNHFYCSNFALTLFTLLHIFQGFESNTGTFTDPFQCFSVCV